MAYIIKARFYCGLDQLGESYVITSDNSEINTRLEVGRRVDLATKESICRNCQDPKPGKMIHVTIERTKHRGSVTRCAYCGREITPGGTS